MAFLKFYVLPADQCANALMLYTLAMEDALTAKRELLARYGADAILRSGKRVEALAWCGRPMPLPGFTAPRLDSRHGVWLLKPRRNTRRGKEAALELDHVGELLEIWQWSLERALGVYGSVLGYYRGSRVFLHAVARPLEDGRVVLSIPVRDRMDVKYTDGSDPMPPALAMEIDQPEAERLLGKPIAELA